MTFFEDNAGLVFGDLGPHRVDVGLPHRIGRARPDISVESTAFEQMAYKLLRPFWSANVQRAAAAQNPARDDEEWQFADVVVMQVRQQEMRDVGGIGVDAHHLARRAMPAIDQEMPATVEREQDRRMTAVRVRQRSSGAEQDDPHDTPP
jgi:hypothetical protein